MWPCAKAEEVTAVNATAARSRAVLRIFGSNRADTGKNLQSSKNSSICQTFPKRAAAGDPRNPLSKLPAALL
jgi:hypothetical protein